MFPRSLPISPQHSGSCLLFDRQQSWWSHIACAWTSKITQWASGLTSVTSLSSNSKWGSTCCFGHCICLESFQSWSMPLLRISSFWFKQRSLCHSWQSWKWSDTCPERIHKIESQSVAHETLQPVAAWQASSHCFLSSTEKAGFPGTLWETNGK